MGSYLLAPVLLLVVLLQDHCDATAGGIAVDSSDASSIPLLASGKRQHNIMRFGKRPAGGHSLIHFGKREEGGSSPKHSFLYFGKRDVPDLLDYLQKNRDGSYKRGHTIMRFGKRAPDSHNFIRFGRAPDDDTDKRTTSGHAMMYFGKRAGHSMMYFGKRGDEDKRAHAMIHFGKRDDDWEEFKRGGAHSMIHFGKRVPEEEEEDWSPEMIEEEESKRGGAHSMIHFGKRVGEEEEDEDWSPEMIEAKRQQQHNLLRFGKKMDRKGSHAMIHFGKRETGEDKRAHAMIHFGKRSGDEALANQADKGPLNRMKREAEQHAPAPLITLVRYEGEDGGPNQDETPKEGLNTPAYYRPDEMWSPLYHQDKDWEPDYVEYSQPDKKDGSKNVFLRFG